MPCSAMRSGPRASGRRSARHARARAGSIRPSCRSSTASGTCCERSSRPRTSATPSCSSRRTSRRRRARRCRSTAAWRTRSRADGVATTSVELGDRLAAYVARRLGVERVAVESLRRLAGGASRELWSFDVVQADGGRERLVLRRDPPGQHLQSSRRDEFALLRAAAEGGLPVPRVRWCEDAPDVLGSAFFVMDFVEGETLARRLLRDAEYAPARAGLPAQLADALARIHLIDPGLTDLAFLPRPTPEETPAAAELGRYEQIYRAIAPDPHPALELALRWLAPRLPAPRALTVVH